MGHDPSLLSAIHSMVVVTHFDVASCTMFLWDHLLTLGMEVDLVWKAEWNVMKFLFFFQRYLPYVDTCWLVLHHQLGSDISKGYCRLLYLGRGFSYAVGAGCSELILTLRVWAVWHRNMKLAVFLSILFVACLCTEMFFMYKFTKAMKFGDPPYPGSRGCFIIEGTALISYCWGVLMFWDTLTFILMLIPGVRAFKQGGQSALIKSIYRDGFVYYVYLFILSLLNITLVLRLPSTYLEILSSFERCIHSMLSSRVLLHIRVFSTGEHHWMDGLTHLQTSMNIESEMAFHRNYDTEATEEEPEECILGSTRGAVI